MNKSVGFILVCVLTLLAGCKWFGCSCCREEKSVGIAATTKTPGLTVVTTMEEFEKEVLKATKPVVVKFTAPWCSSCQSMKPIVDAVAQEFQSKYLFVEIDIDKASPIAKKYGITGVPTIIFFKNGSQLKDAKPITGDVSTEKLKETIEKTLGL